MTDKLKTYEEILLKYVEDYFELRDELKESDYRKFERLAKADDEKQYTQRREK